MRIRKPKISFKGTMPRIPIRLGVKHFKLALPTAKKIKIK